MIKEESKEFKLKKSTKENYGQRRNKNNEKLVMLMSIMIEF
jgi:hypothetical protein